jgi:EAL and modified HD-GYP domain-containing signal transduction protein
MLELLPADQMVLEILETVEITSTVIERCATLKRRGFTIALDDVGQLSDAQSHLLPHIDIVKLDLMLLGDEKLSGAVSRLKDFRGKLLAEKLDRPEQFATCLELGFDLFQGYYFAKPAVLSAKRADPSKLSLLKLLGLVLGDAENNELETAFKQDAKLPYNLLKLVNSVGAGTNQKITSLAQAIMVLGRRQLQRWMQLLLFAMQGDGGAFPNPLTQLAATRGKMMEIMARIAAGSDRTLSDRAYMVGVFSLLDVLLAMPMQNIMDELNLSDDMREALLERSGTLGQLLRLSPATSTAWKPRWRKSPNSPAPTSPKRKWLRSGL